MKWGLQLLLHVAAAFAGFWLASSQPPMAHSPPVAAKKAAVVAKTQTSPPPPMPARSLSRTERLGPRLTPQRWPEVHMVIEKADIGELPAMLQVILGSRYPDVRRRAVELLFMRWTELDRDAALAAMKTITSPQLKEMALDRILFEWAKSDATAAWQWVTAIEDDSVLQESGIEELLANGAEKDPQGYAAWAAQIEDPFLRYKALDQIASTWGRADPKGAFAAALEMNDPVLRKRVLEVVCYQEKSGIDRAKAMDLILQLPDKAARIELLSDDWIRAFANDKPEAALHWLVSHANNPDLQKVSGTLGGVLGEKVKNVVELRAMALQVPAGVLRDAFSAEAAWRRAASGGSVQEARELLTLCGPCIEREFALDVIEESATKP